MDIKEFIKSHTKDEDVVCALDNCKNPIVDPLYQVRGEFCLECPQSVIAPICAEDVESFVSEVNAIRLQFAEPILE
jgi:hypothetical protein